MSEDKSPVVEPKDDATVVHDEHDEEKAHADLVANVSKRLGRDEYGEPTVSKSDETPPSEAKEADDSKAQDEKKDEQKPVLSKDTLERAEKAGLSQALAESLHQSGQLDQTLAAFDRVLVERFQSTETEKPKRRDAEPSQEDAKAEDDVPDLDPDVYDEEIVKRDKFHKQRIDQLEAKLGELLQERQEAFDNWFDGTLTELGYDIADEDKCQKTFKAYQGICQAHGIDPSSRNQQMVERAHAAMFPDEVTKKAQQQTVDRLRDAEGKFLSSSKPKGAPPSKDATDEEVHDQLVSNVTSYLRKRGVQMSGM